MDAEMEAEVERQVGEFMGTAGAEGVRRLGMSLSVGMQQARTTSRSRAQVAVANEVHLQPQVSMPPHTEWPRLLMSGKVRKSRVVAEQMVQRFVWAYMDALASMAPVPYQHLEAKAQARTDPADRQVTIYDIFDWMPGPAAIFCATLGLLRWAGMLGSTATFQTLRYALRTALDAYSHFEAQASLSGGPGGFSVADFQRSAALHMDAQERRKSRDPFSAHYVLASRRLHHMLGQFGGVPLKPVTLLKGEIVEVVASVSAMGSMRLLRNSCIVSIKALNATRGTSLEELRIKNVCLTAVPVRSSTPGSPGKSFKLVADLPVDKAPNGQGRRLITMDPSALNMDDPENAVNDVGRRLALLFEARGLVVGDLAAVPIGANVPLVPGCEEFYVFCAMDNYGMHHNMLGLTPGTLCLEVNRCGAALDMELSARGFRNAFAGNLIVNALQRGEQAPMMFGTMVAQWGVTEGGASTMGHDYNTPEHAMPRLGIQVSDAYVASEVDREARRRIQGILERQAALARGRSCYAGESVDDPDVCGSVLMCRVMREVPQIASAQTALECATTELLQQLKATRPDYDFHATTRTPDAELIREAYVLAGGRKGTALLRLGFYEELPATALPELRTFCQRQRELHSLIRHFNIAIASWLEHTEERRPEAERAPSAVLREFPENDGA